MFGIEFICEDVLWAAPENPKLHIAETGLV